MSELLPCPFCGGPADGPFDRDNMWLIECLESPCTVNVTAYGDSKEKAIAAWNRRPVTEAAPSSPAWVELARAVAVAELDSSYQHGYEVLIEDCRRVIRMAQQEAAPGGLSDVDRRTLEWAEMQVKHGSRVGLDYPEIGRLAALVRRLLTPAPNREAELKVWEPPEELIGRLANDYECDTFIVRNIIDHANRARLASLAQSEMKGSK